MRMKWAVLAPVLIIGLSACQVNTGKYYWGTYSQSLYDYYQDSTEEKDYRESLSKVVAYSGTKQKVPPGLFAEHGYMLLASGDQEGAIRFFEREKLAWPESTIFMDRAIAAARGHTTGVMPEQAMPAGTPTS